MKLDEILRRKGRNVVTISESATVLDAVRLLVEENIGGVVVTEGDRPVGILTERDILRLTAAKPGELGSVSVGDSMTRDLITAPPDARLEDMMDVMTDNKIRHLPVVEDHRLAGIVSIGDLVNAVRLEAEEERRHLRNYIQGRG